MMRLRWFLARGDRNPRLSEWSAIAEQALLSKGRLPKDVPTFSANEVLTTAKTHTIP
jgi:hypothetical protein